MRALLNQLIAGWKRPLLLAVVAAVLILSLGSDCGPAAQVEFGYNYGHVTPPQWTPDGKHVVLSRYGAITVVALDGSGSFWRIHEVLDRLNDRSVRFDDSYAPNISPDGTEIAYMHRYTRDEVARDLNYEIHVASFDGSNIRRLTENDYHEASPVWSPDNTRIAYWSSSLESPAWALMTMAKDGTDKRHVITIDRGDPPPVVWSPDRRRLAFVQFHRSVEVLEYAIHVVGADGSNPTRLAPTSSSPLWAHDGDSIFFVHVQEVEGTADVSAALYSIRTDGTDLRIVADIGMWPKTFRFRASLNWSADGSELWSSGPLQSVSIRADGTEVSYLRPRQGVVRATVTHSPEGPQVAVHVRSLGLNRPEDENIIFFLMDPDGSNQRNILRSTAEGVIWEQRSSSTNVIDWEMTQYTPTQEQDAQTTATAG